MTAQGNTVLNHFDIIAAAGGRKPIAKAFQVTVTNGVLNVNFAGVVGAATVSGIQIIP